jgi:hypothetical protein
MGRVKSVDFHQHVMRRRKKSDNDGGGWGELKRRSVRCNQLGACHDLALLTRLTAPLGKAFVKKWRVLGIFIGRFFGRLCFLWLPGIFELRELNPECGRSPQYQDTLS